MDSWTTWLVLAALAIAFVAGAFFVGRYLQRNNPRLNRELAQVLFQRERLALEKLFFQAASASGKPRGLRWKECQWDHRIAWLSDKRTGQLLALAGVTISFEAIEGGSMEGVEAVGNLRNASAVFYFNDGRWQTAGRTIFNLDPDEAVQHFQQGYERVP